MENDTVFSPPPTLSAHRYTTVGMDTAEKSDYEASQVKVVGSHGGG